MKKIGIMSMQRIYNYGSFLQGYALKKLIESLDSENEVSFVDYEPGETLVKSNAAEPTGLKRKMVKLKEYYNVDTTLKNKIRFFNHKRTYGKRFYPLLGIEDNFKGTEELDVLVIGSDEVFNCVQSNTNVGYSRDLFGHNTNAKKVISYAGSFGNTTFEKIENYNIKNDLKEDFSDFAAVSVRDENSLEIVKKLGIDNPVLNVDPVLAYDYMNLENNIPKERLYNQKYMIVYGYSGRLSAEENINLRQYAKDKNLKILCFGGVQGCCDEFIDCSPFELLAYFRDAEAIVTDTFHGTIFSIINRKPFATIIRESVGDSYGNEEKLCYLLKLTKTDSQQVSNLTLGNINNILQYKIKYDSIEKMLNIKRKETRDFLENNI